MLHPDQVRAAPKARMEAIGEYKYDKKRWDKALADRHSPAYPIEKFFIAYTFDVTEPNKYFLTASPPPCYSNSSSVFFNIEILRSTKKYSSPSVSMRRLL